MSERQTRSNSVQRGGIMPYKAGQSWSYAAPEGFEHSRIVIGAIATYDGRSPIICCSVVAAPQRQPDGELVAVTIPFLPLSEDAFARSVIALDAAEHASHVAGGFADALDEWQSDPRGLSCFTVAFDGFLDRLIAHQMAAIVGSDAA